MHLRVLVAVCLVAATFGQIVTNLDGISFGTLIAPTDAAVQAGVVRPTSTITPGTNVIVDNALDNVNLYPILPLSARAIYRHFRNQDANLIATNPGGVRPESDPFYNLFLVEGRDLQSRAVGATANTLQVWLQPYNQPNCGDAVRDFAAVSLLPPCGIAVNFPPLSANGQTNIQNVEQFPACRLLVAQGQTGYETAPNNDNKVAFLLPVNRLALQLQQSAWVCVRARNPLTPTATAALPINSNLIYQVAPRCDADTPVGGLGIRAPDYADNVLDTVTVDPFAHACSVQAGVDLQAETGLFYANAVLGFGELPISPAVNGITPSNEIDYFERRQRTRCCGWRPGGLTDATGNTLVKRWGVCINPLTETCCSSREDARGSAVDNIGGVGKPLNRFSEKCCYGGTSTVGAQSLTVTRTAGEPVAISFLDDNCPCDPIRVRDFCGATQQCCSFTKFPELVITINNTGAIGTINNAVTGRCFDPREQSCCDTGEIFNGGVSKCCSVNGVTDLDTPCPCNLDSDCGSDSSSFCCRQVFPVPVETSSCSPYVNYPTGTGAAAAQRCSGFCIDTRFQICCNGAVCLDEYESCCNNTCCNRFSSDCKMGYRAGSSGSRFSSSEFNVPFEVCTEIEAVTPYRATFAYILPAGLLAASFIGMAFTLFFAKRMNALNPLSTYERAMMALSLLIVVISWPLYFSPMYKYGVVFTWVAFFTIVAALAGLKRLVVFALVCQLIVLVYIFDPFGGNEILNLAYHRVDRLNGFGYSGVFLSIRNLWNDTSSNDAFDYPGWRCVDFYDGYFLRDPLTEDRQRLHDPLRQTYGYCGREWISVLIYLSGVITVAYITLFVVTLITHAKNVLVKKVISQNPLHY